MALRVAIRIDAVIVGAIDPGDQFAIVGVPTDLTDVTLDRVHGLIRAAVVLRGELLSDPRELRLGLLARPGPRILDGRLVPTEPAAGDHGFEAFVTAALVGLASVGASRRLAARRSIVRAHHSTGAHGLSWAINSRPDIRDRDRHRVGSWCCRTGHPVPAQSLLLRSVCAALGLRRRPSASRA